MVWTGLVIGAVSFLIIGIFHPIVIKCEYYFSARVWPVFLIGGLMACLLSMFARQTVLSAILGVLGFTMLWSIGELKHQEERVRKGWFPVNPKRTNRGHPSHELAPDDESTKGA